MRIPKLIAIDVDGTLYDSAGNVSERVRAAIQQARQHEIPVAIASGRPLKILPSTNALAGGVDWNIGGNGATVADPSTGELLLDATVGFDVAERIIQGVRTVLPGAGFCLETVTSNLAEPGFNRRIPADEPAEEVLDVLAGRDRSAGVRKTIVFHDDFDHRLDELAAIAAPFVDEICETHHWGLPIVEFSRRGTDKSHALAVLAAHLGIEAADVLAFGDGGNDHGMLSWAGVGVAMGNASEQIQSIANEVTRTNDEDGIAVFLEPLLDQAAQQNTENTENTRNTGNT